MMSLTWRFLACMAFLLAGAVQPGLGQTQSPNIVLILADDLGWSDVGCYGADLIETPQIDRLAAEGMRFTQAYASAPVCSPTRAAIMTGKAPARVRITIWSEGSVEGPQNRPLLQGESLHDLPHEETTIAEALRERGYLTAIVGKWHLGDASHYPETQGFDVNIGGTHWGAPNTFFWPYRGDDRYPEFRYVPDLEFGERGEYLTDRLTDEAVRVIDQAGEQPFFLMLSHYTPHTPIEAKEEDVAYFEKRLEPDMHHQNPVYAAMVKSLDESVGRIREELQRRDLERKTLFVFTSDNGGFIGVDRKSGQTAPVTNNHPLRSGKGSCYEGGLRVPLIVRWPGVTGAGSESDEPVILTDLFPTFAAAAGTESPSPDGRDLTPLLAGRSESLDRETLYFHYPHYYPTTTPVGAIRAGDWKLLEYFEDGHVELYNLAQDLGEMNNLAGEHPEKAAALKDQLHAWRESVGASMPTVNPGR